MGLYAQVIADISSDRLDQVFSYAIPEELQESIRPGSVVEVPFGRGGRRIRGYVLRLEKEAGCDPAKIKEIAGVLTESFDPRSELIALAAWMKERYGCSMAQALRTVLPVRKAIREKERKYLTLGVSREEGRQLLCAMNQKRQKARARLLEALLEQGSLSWELARDKLHITSAQVKALEEKGIVAVQTTRSYRNISPLPQAEREKAAVPVVLNEEQQALVDEVIGGWKMEEEQKPCLLYGVTGSGKTEVYMALIEHAVRQRKQAIVLIPEIALTWQTLVRFYRRFGSRVSVIHSRLSAGERYDQFQRALEGDIDIMIGPRSALFTPFQHLGIIVIDEEHEPSYISESAPCYHAVETAWQRAAANKALLVLGSATPSVTSFHAAKEGRMRLLRLTKRAGDARLPQVRIVDLREEPDKGTPSMFSRVLSEAVEETLDREEQVMLFLNRRGYAGFVSCRSCGQVIRCPHCDVALSLHHPGKLVCHYCGYTIRMPGTCPECGSGFLRSFRAGTQQVEEEVRKRFPDARVLRMDLDTTRGKEDHAAILSAFSGREADILIGTQMIVKGHDFPSVTLVGILAADLSLYVPDYRSSERTFQLLTQAAGRAGRGERAGSVIIQSYDPRHYSIQCAARQDYEAFYEAEMAYRTMSDYPPVGGMIALHCSGEDEAHLEKACGYLAQFAMRFAPRYGMKILGPSDEPVAKIQDIYRKVLYIKAPGGRVLAALRAKLEQYVEMNEGFRTVSIRYEVL